MPLTYLVDNTNSDYSTSSTTTTTPAPKAIKLLCKCKRNFDLDGSGGSAKVRCLEKNCLGRVTSTKDEEEEWPIQGTR